ncbi:vacuolar protein sorting-associated protein 13D isoform X1 [Trichogramma pretiosum]|uniref:vacuolar protein sorting-associated protein 13D isoform X1 n=1 Tax=Trichogramma pretiosum TaxID=7493 RepID=UPI0006C9D6FE|nr:vacuolar protein sorting-associated protein 13D isoform X1 [Trichogramma pretiosum]
MLEGLVAWVLNNYLGNYVENLNTDQLSIALLSGAVELENLPLKLGALRRIGLPVEIKAGFIGKVRLQVPVTQIRTAPWVIAIEQLYLVAGPINLDEYDSEAEEQAMVDYKLSRLEALEARWRAESEQGPGYYAASYSTWVNYGTSLMTNIIENLQLVIKDVHLRYEDTVTLPNGNGIAFGVTIGGLTAQSCDASWVPGSTSWNLSDASFKLMELDDLSVYWNQMSKEQTFHNLNLGDLAVAMNESKKHAKNYILSPVSAKAHVKRDRTERPLRSAHKPRIVVDLSLDQVPLSITDVQYEQIVQCIKGLEEIDRQRRQRRCRPIASIKETPKEWWRYAARCYVGPKSLQPKKSWGDILELGKKNVLYVEACAKLLLNPTSSLPPDLKKLKDQMELKMSFDELRVLRELAMAKIRPPKPPTPTAPSPQAKGMLYQWFPQWWGWQSSKSSDNGNGSPGNISEHGNSSSTFDGELLDVLADAVDDDTLLRRDTVFGLFNFQLSKGAISLCTVLPSENGKPTETKKIMELQFERVHLSYESRPRSGSHKFSISLGALYLHDHLTENSTFPILVQPQTIGGGPSSFSRLRSSTDKLTQQQALQSSLFELVYEKRPLHLTVDHSLHVTSRSLDVVYNPVAMRWLVDFVYEPHRRDAFNNQRLQAMKRRTRRRLMKNWEQILEGDSVYRSSWDLQLNISAPQILLVEKFNDANALVVVVDFGRLHLTNSVSGTAMSVKNVMSPVSDPDNTNDDDEEDERYETPCSTPPGSEEDNSAAPDLQQGLSEAALHKKLYDHYSVDLSDLQVLVGKVKDNWKHARTKGMSNLHVLERFNISLQIQRRVVTTTDPHFPSVTVSGNLPRLVVHINEQKVESIRTMYNLLSNLSSTSPVTAKTNGIYMQDVPESPKKEEPIDKTLNHAIMVQFIIDQMTFELQSRGRPVAELRVTGVRAALSKRPADFSASLSVHGLLLVDALQEFGPDFELLVASHKHVGMDSISGSLRDSEPTSPTSPASTGSPDPHKPRRITSPVALTHALSNLAHQAPFLPHNNSTGTLEQLDSEALIVVELMIVDEPLENLRVANIQFNNLDIIANQETIVELMGFARRCFPSKKSKARRMDRYESVTSLTSEGKATRTEIAFDFHRLNVLLLRAVMQDSQLIGQKIATATMSDARIQATLASDTSISGSLGGLQILDQTSTGKTHQRVISVGRDPLAEQHSRNNDKSAYDEAFAAETAGQLEAFSFSASRIVRPDTADVLVDIGVRVGSVWYTHAPHLISELRSCADEFKQYLSNWARQIGAAATDMAIGLVGAEDWAIPQRKRLPSFSIDGMDSTNHLLKLDLLLDSPVIVIPRSSQSGQVFVAHLGTMSLQHEPPSTGSTKQKISFEVKNMNLHSLDVSEKLNQPTSSCLPLRAEEMYCCKENGRPILHDTLLQVTIERDLSSRCQSPGYPIEIEGVSSRDGTVEINGIVATPLKVSLVRNQYEQLIDTVHRLFSAHSTSTMPNKSGSDNSSSSTSASDESSYTEKFDLPIKVLFKIPALSVELKQEGRLEQPLVELSMRDLCTKFEKLQRGESTTEVSLRSLLMEDLLCPVGSRHRYMMQSSAPTRARLLAGVSRSCPDLTIPRLLRKSSGLYGSLPDNLETDTLYGPVPSHWRRGKPVTAIEIPNTPPPSPGAISTEENLVLINITTNESESGTPNRHRKKRVTIDFNCLDLVVSVESWMVVLDFLGFGSPSSDVVISTVPTINIDEPDSRPVAKLPVHSDTEIEINSLTLVLTQSEREIARVNISSASTHIVKTGETTKVSGSLGSMSLLDLTPHGRFYRERFVTSGRKALNFQYTSYANSQSRPHDAELKLQMSSVHYVHTQRFIAELQAFFAHFAQLRNVMVNLQAGGSAVIDFKKRSTRLSLELHAGAPVILLPVSSRSEELILLDLGELSANNKFVASSINPECLLDTMSLELVNMDVYTAKRIAGNYDEQSIDEEDTLNIGSYAVKKTGPSLLNEKCHLKLRIERNLDAWLTREIPEVSVHGTLSTMDCALDPSQYTLIRGLLAHNIGENLDDLVSTFTRDNSTSDQSNIPVDSNSKAWTTSFISFELVNVTLKLHSERDQAALACVNFIKSRLILESLSDGSQDVDLVSREILVTDTRFQDEPVNRRSNVFTSILQPLKSSSAAEDRVQAEVHHRKRKNCSATTILLHSMRLTAILDWWEAVRDILVLNSPEPAPLHTIPVAAGKESIEEEPVAMPFELKLNITESELVLVEDTSMWDTNAVILKSTAVLAYRSKSQNGEKPLSCNLSHCELFSCILGLEEETALSIIDPVGASLELTAEKCLEIHLQPLSVRLSYHDVNMFTRMLRSLPKQTLLARQRSSLDENQPANSKSHILKLSALGFTEVDCETALDKCNGHLDDAALWLTQNAVPSSLQTTSSDDSPLTEIRLETSCLKICIIDDCRDADVPLLELTLVDLVLRQEYCGPGDVSGTFSIDYYNRVLSGWEPFVEQWRASMQWEQALSSSSLSSKRLRIRVDSQDSVNVNITSTLVEMFTLVKENWTQDYYSLSEPNKGDKKNYRRRSPFVPFALKNETGSRIWFKTLIATAEDDRIVDRDFLRKNALKKDQTWLEVASGETIPFTFENRGKLRHHSTHIVRRHQVAVVVEGWKVVDPVTVDRVGVYFRHARFDFKGSEMINTKARIVFNVELEGSARKLVTVRSALQVINKLKYSVDLKLDKSMSYYGYSPTYTSALTGRILQVPAQSRISIPLSHTDVQMYVKPVQAGHPYQYCIEPIDWTTVKKMNEVIEVQTTSRTPNLQQTFRMCVAVRRDNYPVDTSQTLPGHTITILAPMTLTNLLPHELYFTVGTESGRILPGESSDLHSLNVTDQLEISIQMDGYPGSGTFILPQNSCSFTGRMRLSDSQGRILFIHATVIVERGMATRINITAPYWIINKTGLPLVFKQEGASNEFAGQFEEHEKARMVAPLLFSFNDEEISGTLSVRVGTGVHSNGIPQWCQSFHLQPGVQVHRLRVCLRDGRPDIVYLIGITARAARGRYRATTVVTLSPRYQLHNKSSWTLELAQKCFTTTVTHPVAQATYITAMPDCHMPFHWPRLDKDQLLCVRVVNIPNCSWSGGILLQGNHSLTINIRDSTGQMFFLRVDVVLQESTFFIVFTDAHTMPPPIRVDNFSEVPLTLNQTTIQDSLQWTVRPHCSVPYALDEPTLPTSLTVTAPGGVTAAYDLNVLGECRGLTYENFIYIAFTGTFKADGDLGTGEAGLDPLDVETQRLVLEAGPGGWVALRRKQYGARSQLWRMTGDGQLQHEGSSPPRDKHSRTPDTVLVLDIAGTAPQPFTFCPLALRRPDPRRRSTQTWRFTDDGRLCCVHANMCVQSKDGFMGLQEGGRVARWQMWSEAVLGPQMHCNPPPIEQRVARQRLRPGSGYLSVRVTTDGPTRVLQVLDIKERKRTFALLEERDWSNISVTQRPTQLEVAELRAIDARELYLSVDLPAGLGLSLVSSKPAEELIFARFAGIALDYVDTPASKSLELSINDVQIDNQLFEAQCTSVVYISRASRGEGDSRPAIHVAAEKLPSKNQNAEIYKHLIVSVKPVCVHLEERLILKFAAFVGAGSLDQEVPVDENDFNAQRLISNVSAAHAKRYYFAALKLVPSQVELSVLTTTKLPPHLQAIKKKLGLTLIKFEDATIELEPFIRKHPFESSQFLIHSIIKHYKDELKWQAAVILGSVDFLGSPLGFVNDVSEGVSSLIYDRSVKTLVKNVTHGFSNSAAKLSESLSEGFGRVIMDDWHEEVRQRIRSNTTGSKDHLVAGFKGLGFGLFSGVISIGKQTYDGVINEGFPGFFAGLGKGVVGTITKPAVGILDFATESSIAIRESSRSAHRQIPKRDRLPRVPTGPAGLLPPYNSQQTEGQELLHSINNRDYSELFVIYECLRTGADNLKVLVSNERVIVISGNSKCVVTEVSLADLLYCQPTHRIEANGSTLHYIELTSRTESSNQMASFEGAAEMLRRPKVRCDNEEVAKWVSRQINYAKGMHEERRLTLTSTENVLDDMHLYK